MQRRSARVVIGANFGDEGKGLITDYFVSQAPSVTTVVRFNSGAQAGHTVVTPQGLRHVFGHIGAGALAGADTFLSRFFVCNPILFQKEQLALSRLGIAPSVIVDPRAPITTPYDMLINQLIEATRGSARHGSCGIGFGETIERSLSADFALTAANLGDSSRLRQHLEAIRHLYVPARLSRLGISDQDNATRLVLQSDDLLDAFVTDAARFLDAVTIGDGARLATSRELLFEGAQGLGLDQDRGYFPHVTRSNTGLHNVLALAEELRIGRLDVTYATRSYLTRHGAGPMLHEMTAPPYPGVVDQTNIPNPFQGNLRFGLLDLDTLAESIAADLGDAAATTIAVSTSLAVTCLDQLSGAPARFVQHGRQRQAGAAELLERAAAATQVAEVYAAAGPTRQTVERCRAMPGRAVA